MSYTWKEADEVVRRAKEAVDKFPEEYEHRFPSAPPGARKVNDAELVRYVDMMREMYPPTYFTGPLGTVVYESPWVLAAAFVHGMKRDVQRYFELIGTPERWRELFPTTAQIRQYRKGMG